MRPLPENILSKMSPKDRASLGPAGMTAEEAQKRFEAGQEKQLQNLITNYLNLHQIYFESDRMDRKTSGKVGRPDFRICYRGRWLAVECKAQGGKLTAAQADTLMTVRKAGGVAITAFSLTDLQTALRGIDQEFKAPFTIK